MSWRVWALAYGLAITIVWGPAIVAWIRWRLTPRSRRGPVERTKGLNIFKGPLDYKE